MYAVIASTAEVATAAGSPRQSNQLSTAMAPTLGSRFSLSIMLQIPLLRPETNRCREANQCKQRASL
jgi:hypothetical protein